MAFTDFDVKPSSAVSCTFCPANSTNQSKAALRPAGVLCDLYVKSALATVSCTLCQPHLPKELRKPIFFLRFWCEIELALQSCALFVGNFCKSRPETAEIGTLLLRPRKPLYPEKQRASRPRVFSSLNSRVPDLLHFPSTWWWCGWHDDVVYMVMVRMLPMTIVRNSEVFT